MADIKFYDSIDDNLLKFAVVISKTKGKWIFCKHRERDTYEVPGGHRESGEDIFSFQEIHSEIEKILITDHLVENWTYPLIQPKLIEEGKNRRYL